MLVTYLSNDITADKRSEGKAACETEIGGKSEGNKEKPSQLWSWQWTFPYSI